MKINLKKAQMITHAKNGQVFVLGDRSPNLFVFAGADAKNLQKEYDKQFKTASGNFKMELQINVEFEESTGEILPKR
jgi:hypothetical protein